MYSSQSAGGWLHTKASTCCSAEPGPRYASKKARRSACGPRRPGSHRSKALPLLITRSPRAQLDARPPNVFAHAPENECSSTVWQSPCASHSERKTSRTSAIGAMWKSVLQKV